MGTPGEIVGWISVWCGSAGKQGESCSQEHAGSNPVCTELSIVARDPQGAGIREGIWLGTGPLMIAQQRPTSLGMSSMVTAVRQVRRDVLDIMSSPVRLQSSWFLSGLQGWGSVPVVHVCVFWDDGWRTKISSNILQFSTDQIPTLFVYLFIFSVQ